MLLWINSKLLFPVISATDRPSEARKESELFFLSNSLSFQVVIGIIRGITENKQGKFLMVNDRINQGNDGNKYF